MIADKLRLKAGDKVYAYFIDEGDVRTRRYTICGIYQTNMTRFDENLCITDLYTANKLNGWQKKQATGVEVNVKDFEHLADIEERFIIRINRTSDSEGNIMTTETIYELYPQVFSWLELLDINVWIILVLMVCGGVYDDQRSAHHHPRAHTNDWHIKSTGCTEQNYPQDISLVFCIYHQPRTTLG